MSDQSVCSAGYILNFEMVTARMGRVSRESIIYLWWLGEPLKLIFH